MARKSRKIRFRTSVFSAFRFAREKPWQGKPAAMTKGPADPGCSDGAAVAEAMVSSYGSNHA